jgi:hypothetical protein
VNEPNVTRLPFAPVTTSALRARFPRLQQTAVDGVYQAQCPVDREHGIFEVREAEDGWRLGLCLDGCLPRDIWEAGGKPQSVPEEAASWGFQTAAEFLAQTFPPIRWLYLDLVPAESVTVIMAAPNAGKTFWALDVVAQVVVKAAREGKHVWVVEEEGTGAALQWRLSRAMAAAGVSASDPAASHIHIAWNTGRSLRNAGHLSTLAQECHGAELIVLDSLSALAGGIDENSSKDMAEIAQALNALKIAAACAILALHHMTKAAWPDGVAPRLEHMRGHGALPGRADTVIALVPLECDATEVRAELHCVKQRDGSKPKARTIAIAMTGAAAVVTMEDKESVAGSTKAVAVEADTLTRIPVDAPGVSKTFLENVVRGHRAQEVRRAVDRLVDAGKVVRTPSGRYVRTPERRHHADVG